jgi:hypothetical protein
MCKTANTNQYEGAFFFPASAMRQRKQAFFSLDAGLATVVVIFSFSSFALLAASAASSAASQSSETSSSLLALRFSSYILEKAAVSSEEYSAGAYYEANELDKEKLRTLDLGEILLKTGKKYASVSVEGENGEIFSSQAGEQGNEKFCSSRLAILSGEIFRLEACIS